MLERMTRKSSKLLIGSMCDDGMFGLWAETALVIWPRDLELSALVLLAACCSAGLGLVAGAVVGLVNAEKAALPRKAVA